MRGFPACPSKDGVDAAGGRGGRHRGRGWQSPAAPTLPLRGPVRRHDFRRRGWERVISTPLAFREFLVLRMWVGGAGWGKASQQGALGGPASLRDLERSLSLSGPRFPVSAREFLEEAEETHM